MGKRLNLIVKKNAEALEWSFNKREDGMIELENWSPLGENIYLEVHADNAVDEIYRAYEDFDCDEHVEMWMDAKRGGMKDVPRVTMLVDDAMAIEKMLEDLSDAVSDDWVGNGKSVGSW